MNWDAFTEASTVVKVHWVAAMIALVLGL